MSSVIVRAAVVFVATASASQSSAVIVGTTMATDEAPELLRCLEEIVGTPWIGGKGGLIRARQAIARLPQPSDAEAEAHAWFRLGQHLQAHGQADEAQAAFARATALHPSSWAMWRQAAPKDARGLASGAAFWSRVDALGDRPYYPPAEIVAPEG